SRREDRLPWRDWVLYKIEVAFPFVSEVTQEIRRPHPKCGCNLDYDREGRHVVSALDEAYVGCADTGAFGQLLLRQSFLLAEPANDGTELLGFGRPLFSQRQLAS